MSKAKRYYNLQHVEPKNYISKVGAHRYGLKFESKLPSEGKSVAIIQMNGSITGFTEDNEWKIDPTIGKVLCWCYKNRSHTFDIVHCLNLFSYVDPHPENLENIPENILNNEENDKWIEQVCDNVDFIILAYGDCEGIAPNIAEKRINYILDMLKNKDLYRVGITTKKGNPKHGRAWNGNPTLEKHLKTK